MDNTLDYIEKLRRDLLEQFKGKPNIEVFQKALANELEEVYKFFSELNTLRWLQEAEGVQLDGIGDIVVMSRAEALVVSGLAGMNVPMDDDNYRLYLTFKIHLNTNECTYRDMFRMLKMFWTYTPLYYSENPDYPATIFITVPEFISDVKMNILQIATKIKAAGVALHYIFSNVFYSVDDYSVGVVNELIKENFTEERELDTEVNDYLAAASYEFIKEVFTEETELPTKVFTYGAGASYEFIKEVFTSNG